MSAQQALLDAAKHFRDLENRFWRPLKVYRSDAEADADDLKREIFGDVAEYLEGLAQEHENG